MIRTKRKPHKTRVVSVRMSDETYKKITDLADKNKTSLSEAANQLIESNAS